MEYFPDLIFSANLDMEKMKQGRIRKYTYIIIQGFHVDLT